MDGLGLDLDLVPEPLIDHPGERVDELAPRRPRPVGRRLAGLGVEVFLDGAPDPNGLGGDRRVAIARVLERLEGAQVHPVLLGNH